MSSGSTTLRFTSQTDGGKTFRRVPTPHGDNHGMWINPDRPEIILQSNDGGANVSLDGGRTWSTQYNQPTAELYQVEVDNQFPYRLYGAQQDNSDRDRAEPSAAGGRGGRSRCSCGCREPAARQVP
jgi:hypothetical protein